MNYPHLLHGKHECESAGKIIDIVEFLHDILKVKSLPGKFPHVVSVHNSCHGVRELGLSSPSERNIEPYSKIKNLLALVDGITIKEPERPDECCGFGGMFSMEERAVLFISECLVIIIDRKNIVSNMHLAYDKIQNTSYGCFISGPSKTADIAQALVMGAQAARDITVIIA